MESEVVFLNASLDSVYISGEEVESYSSRIVNKEEEAFIRSTMLEKDYALIERVFNND